MATFINHVRRSVRADAIETSKCGNVTTAVIKRGDSVVVLIEDEDGAEFTARTGAGPWSALAEPRSTDDITAALR